MQKISTNRVRCSGGCTFEKNTGISHTVPDMAISPAQALKMFSSGALQRKANLLSETEDIGNVYEMDFQDRLNLQSRMREKLHAAKAELLKIETSNAQAKAHNEKLEIASNAIKDYEKKQSQSKKSE